MQIVASLKSTWQLSSFRHRLHDLCGSNEGLRGVPEATAGTCNWIFDNVLFQNWLREDSGILWTHGKPGSGKSTLLKYVAQKLLDRPIRFGLSIATSFHFFSLGHGEVRNTGDDVIDFLREHLMVNFENENDSGSYERFIHCSKIQDTSAKPTQNRGPQSKLNTAIAPIHAPPQDPTILFIDGLDEYEESSAVTSFIWTTLSRLPALHSLRVLISSQLKPPLEHMPQIRLEDNNTTDIRSYCLSTLTTNNAAYRDIISQEIVSRAKGVFLWAKLVVSQLGNIHSVVDNDHTQLPSDLSEAYGWTVDRIVKNGKTSGLTVPLLRWAMFALRPLSIHEMQDALGMSSFIRSQVCEKCGEGNNTTKLCFLKQDEPNYCHGAIGVELLSWGLLEVVDDIVCFAHHSVKDFLLQTVIAQERPVTIHQELALVCLEYLRKTLSVLGDTLKKDQKPNTHIYPFLEYATLHLMDHCRLSGPKFIPSTIMDIFQDLLSPDSDFRNGWITIYNQFLPNSKRFSCRTTTPLHIICYFDLPLSNNEVFGAFSQYCDVRDCAGRTPLSFACEMGHIELCSTLIMVGADIYIRDEVYGQTALGWAIAEGHRDIVQLLLRRGANPEDHLSGTLPLHLAIQRLDITLVQLLLQNGASPRTLDNYTGWSALSLAASLGDIYTISLLLDWGAEALQQDQGNGWTPLHHAISKGHQAALETLMLSLSDPEVENFKFHCPSWNLSWVDLVLSYCLGGTHCHSPRSTTGQQPSTPSKMDGKRRNSRPSGVNNRRKRNKKTRNNSNYGDEDEDEDGDGSQPKGRMPLDDLTGHRRFACPFQKACPEGNRCSNIGFPNMHRVK